MKSDKTNLLILLLFFVILAFPLVSNAQTTGKIAGKVVDANTGEPLPGAQIIVTAKWVEGKEIKLARVMGAAADKDGDFFIINVPPGKYTIVVQMMGYETIKLTNIRVSVNRTYEIKANLKPTVIQGQQVVVVAEPLEMKKDQTSSVRNVSSEEIEKLPVQSIGEVVAIQPGVVAGHFRGGRLDEVSYLIDGMQVDEAFYHTGRVANVNIEVVKEIEVITGTFNAEYGKAMSGIVNVVTKDGGDRFSGSGSINFGNYYTPHKEIFIGLRDSEIDRNKDYKFDLSGPILKNYLNFIINGRYQYNKGHLNGIHRFNVDDYSDFTSYDSTQWYSEHNGTNEYVPMNWGKHYTFFSKLSFKPMNPLKLSLMFTWNDDKSQGYDHFYKYNPYGRATYYRKSKMVAFQINHMPSPNAFYEFKASYVDNYNGNYVYKNPYDKRYVHDAYARSTGPGFLTGGQQKHNIKRTMKDINLKFDFTWQINKNHSLKTGWLYTHHDLDNKSVSIRNKYYGTGLEMEYEYDAEAHKRRYLYYEPVVLPDSSIYSDIYRVKPYEFSCYIQDKMEFDEMVINLGIRYDYFNSNTRYPSQPRNPANQLSFPNNPEKMSTYPKAKPRYQISPRLGISYQLGKTALLRFAYGHFFQMPPLYALYQNHSFLVAPSDFSTTMGNPLIGAQKTVRYEVGLWQELRPGMNLEVAVFYRDIYDLLSAKVITTYNQIRYGLYSNKDYGNVRGLEIKYDLVYGSITANLNYTLQYTRGNADSPTFTFNRAGANMDPVNRMIPMSWDQRHTLNISVGYNKQDYGATVTLYYNSGTPYTWSPLPENPLSRVNLFPNNSHMPSQISVDLNAYYYLLDYKGIKVKLTLLSYNLLDRLNETSVYGSTGRAYTSIVREWDVKSHRSNFNDYWDRIKNPAMFSAPRMIKIGLGITF